MGIETLSPEPPGRQGIQVLPEQESWNEEVMFRMSSLEHDPVCAGFLSFFPFIFNFEKWLATPGSVSWFERRKKQSEIRILKEQLAGQQDLGNGTTACCFPPTPPHPASALLLTFSKEQGVRKGDGNKRQTSSLYQSGLHVPSGVDS